MPKFEIKETPLKVRLPGLKKFGTEERLAAYLKQQYWDEGKSFSQIAKDCRVSTSRIREFFLQLHIRSRSSRWEVLPPKPRQGR